jgi:hypothetical protein
MCNCHTFNLSVFQKLIFWVHQNRLCDDRASLRGALTEVVLSKTATGKVSMSYQSPCRRGNGTVPINVGTIIDDDGVPLANRNRNSRKIGFDPREGG